MTVNFNPNVSSIQTRNNILKANELVKSSYSKLASGKRITTAADDAAGLAIGTRLDAELASMSQNMRVSYDGISMAQTADAAAGQISEKLIEIKELSVQAGNGALSESDVASIQQQIDGLVEDINTISQGTEYNGKALLDGSFSEEIHVSEGESIDLTIEDTQASALNVDNIDVSTQEGIHAAIDAVDAAINQVSDVRANLGAKINRMESSIRNIQTSMVNTAESKARIMDTDYAMETAQLAQAQIKEQAGVSMLRQLQNLSPQSVLSLLG